MRSGTNCAVICLAFSVSSWCSKSSARFGHTHRSITFSVAECEAARVVPRLTRSVPPSLRPEYENKDDPASAPGKGACPIAGVPGTDDEGVISPVLPVPLEPRSESTSESTSRRTAMFDELPYAAPQHRAQKSKVWHAPRTGAARPPGAGDQPWPYADLLTWPSLPRSQRVVSLTCSNDLSK